MIYLSVLKDENGSWYIAKVLTSTINVRGNATGITYGNIIGLDLATRLMEGFWTQEDIYENTGEFMQFKEKVTTFDDVNGVVTNTYIYELMDLDVIKTDLRGRVDSKRDTVYFGGFEFNGKTFYSGISNRSNIQLMLLSSLVDETNFPSDLVWDTVDGERIPMDLATFKLFAKALTDFTRTLFITARSIKDAIDDATDFATIRAAAAWNGELL
jgi:hypothetical protein